MNSSERVGNLTLVQIALALGVLAHHAVGLQGALQKPIWAIWLSCLCGRLTIGDLAVQAFMVQQSLIDLSGGVMDPTANFAFGTILTIPLALVSWQTVERGSRFLRRQLLGIIGNRGRAGCKDGR